LALGAATGVLSVVLSFAILGTVFVGGGFGGLAPTSLPTLNFGRLLLYAVAAFVLSAILTSIVTGAMTEYAVRRYRGEPMTVEPGPPMVPVRRDPHRVHPRGRHRHRDIGPPRFRLLGGRSHRVRLRVRPLFGPDQRLRRFVDRHPRRGRVRINRPPPDAFLRRHSPVPGRTRNRAAAGSRANRLASSFGSASGPLRS